MKQYALARGLSFFSVGLGLAELLAPRKVAELIGVQDDHDNLIRMLGARELASGLGILQGKPAYFLWSRVAGDIMDLGLLAAAMRNERNDRGRLQGAIAAVAAVTVFDVLASVAHSRKYEEPGWRVRDTDRYEGAFSREDPLAMRASSDEAMSRYESGHVREAADPLAANNEQLGQDHRQPTLG